MRLVLPDALDAEQRSVFDTYARTFAPGGVCVNVILGRHPWDIRPLVLEQGRVFLYRFSPRLASAARSSLATELEGFSVLPHWELKVKSIAALEQFLVIRPFFQNTLADQIKRGEIVSGREQLALVRAVIEQVRLFARRNLAHGHVSLSNLTSTEKGVVLLDPRMGVLAGVQDRFSAPESVPGEEPEGTADLFGLGRVIEILLGDDLSREQREIVSQLTLPSPRQRPALTVVEDVFCDPREATANSRQPASAGMGAGRLLTSSRNVPVEKAPAGGSERAPHAAAAVEIIPGLVTRATKPGLTKVVVYGVVLSLAILALLRFRFPTAYYRLSEYLPILSPQASEEYETAWASGERVKMRKVARAAALDGEPAAKNTIISDVMAGSTPPLVNVALMRFALDELWRDDLSYRDVQAVVNLTVSQLVPEGMERLPPFQSLHPAVILAVAGQMPPTSPSAQLKSVSLDTLATLPEPIGNVFEQLKALGGRSLADPEAMGLAAIVIGRRSPAAIEAYVGNGEQVEQTLARIAVALPLLATSEEVASQFVATLRDRGGPLSQALGWFDIEDLAQWSRVPSAEKLKLLLGKFPDQSLSLRQYADLLLFPLPSIRKDAVHVLKTQFFTADAENMLALLSGDQNRLTREQNLALLTSLQLKSESRIPFISTWFQMQPQPEVVLLILLSRANLDSNDLFNLEAARFLKKSEWRGTSDLVRLLARHPEPLARSLAYARLDPMQTEDRRILEERIAVETDEALKKLISIRIERAKLRLQQGGAGGAAPPSSGDTPVVSRIQ